MKMKPYAAIAFTVVLTVALLTGCAPVTAAPSVAASPSTAPIADELDQQASEACYAYESRQTPEQIAALERARKDEIQQQYEIYAPFGLTYDWEKDLFFYEGKTVRYFRDTVNLWNTNGFFYENGVIDLAGKRDDTGELIGLVPATQEEFDALTAERKKHNQSFAGAIGQVSEAVGYESDDLSAHDSSFDPYKPYGVSYDEVAKMWMFDGKPIHILYDGDATGGLTYTNESVINGINVQVVRDEHGRIAELTQMTEADMQKIME